MEELTLRQVRKSRLLPLLATTFLLVGYGYFLVRNTAFSVGGSDSSGYMNTARRLVDGTLVGPPRTLVRYAISNELLQIFIPLGFVEGPRPGTMAPYYPSGFPAHMAAAALLLGWQRGPFLVAPFAALLSVPLFYLLARELSLSRAWAAAATAVFAAWPVLIGQAIQPMSDATATLWALAAVLCAVKARRRNAWALGAGAALGIAVLVRPTNALLAIPLAFALPVTLRALALFLTGGVPFAAALAAYDLHCYGSPLQSGYGKTGLLGAVALGNFPPRSRHYGGWILRSLTPLIPIAWFGFAADRRAAWRDRALLLSWFACFFLFYCLYEPYDSFWFVRFLLPGVPGLILGAFLAARDLAMRLPQRRWLTAIGVASLLVVFWTEARSTRAVGLLNTARYESVYPEICGWAARTLPARSVVMSMAASGALEHYTDLAYARWDWIEPAKFPGLRRRIEERGGLWFALLFPFEAEEMFKQPRGRWKKIGVLRDVGLYELQKD
jgi:hypothetical protein